MEKIKFNAMAFIAMLATAGAAYAFTPEDTETRQNENTWARNANGQWRNLTQLGMEDANCEDALEACKLFYEVGTAPITGTEADPGYLGESEETGFVDIP